MKGLQYLVSAALAIVLMIGCQKELSFDTGGVSSGTLKSAATGDCLPSIVMGSYQVDSVLTNLNYIDVHVNVDVAGTFVVKSDTVNGYSFFKAGSVGVGDNVVRLYATGKPIAAGTNSFIIQYGSTVCTVDVSVTGPGGGSTAAVYTLGGSPGACTGGSAAGTFTVGTALSAGNTLTVTVNVTSTGSFTIGAPPVNGIAFGATGSFTTTGIQTVTLQGTGTPVAAGAFNYSVTNGNSACTLSITAVAATPPAAFTLTGAPGSCTGFTLNGTYTTGIALTAANTAVLAVNVTSIGNYNFSSNTMNGVSFSATGNFTATGNQTVTIRGTGTPAAAGSFNYTITGSGGTSCVMSVTYLPPAPPATFTLSGAPGACTAATVNGTYAVATPLGASNIVQLQVNVTVIGSYTLSTNTVNGMTFSGSGNFTTTGIQPVILTGSGTALVAGTNTFTPAIGSSSCTFDVLVTAPTGIYTCKIDGIFYSFYDRAHAETDDGFGGVELYTDGYVAPPNGNTIPEFQMFITNNNNTPVTPGTYNVDGILLPNGYQISVDYTVVNPDLSVTIWNTSSTIFTANPPFTIVVTSATPTRVKGTFSGQITNTLQGSTATKTVTEGVFDLPVQ